VDSDLIFKVTPLIKEPFQAFTLRSQMIDL